MRRRWLLFLLLGSTPTLPACGDGGADVDFGARGELQEDRHVIHTTDGAIRMGLTDEFVYFTLSDSVIAEARAEMEDTMPQEGIRGALSGIVRSGVRRALDFRARYPVADIRDIRWQDGRMIVEFEDGRTSLGDNLQVDGGPVEEAFTEEDVRAFAQEFRRVKRRGP